MELTYAGQIHQQIRMLEEAQGRTVEKVWVARNLWIGWTRDLPPRARKEVRVGSTPIAENHALPNDTVVVDHDGGSVFMRVERVV